VWYRGAMKDQADRLGVAGWVRNRPDGTVEAVIEGTDGAVAALLEWCRRGPPAARVESVDPREEPAENVVGFRIAGYGTKQGGTEP
jgi:acylphosphatase